MAFCDNGSINRNRRAQFRNTFPFKSINPVEIDYNMEVVSSQSSSPSNPAYTSPIRTGRTIREVSKEIDDLRKENFKLKLHIFFIEEKIVNMGGLENLKNVRINVQSRVETADLEREIQYLHRQLDEKEKLISENEQTLHDKVKELNEAEKIILLLRKQISDLKQQVQHKEEVFYSPIDSESELAARKAFGFDDGAFIAKLPSDVVIGTVAEELDLKQDFEKLQSDFEDKVQELQAATNLINELERDYAALNVKSMKKSKAIQALIYKFQKKFSDKENELGHCELLEDIQNGVDAAEFENIVEVAEDAIDTLERHFSQEEQASDDLSHIEGNLVLLEDDNAPESKITTMEKQIASLQLEKNDLKMQLEETTNQRNIFARQTQILQDHLENLAKFLERLLQDNLFQEIREKKSDVFREVTFYLSETRQISQLLSETFSDWHISRYYSFDYSLISDERALSLNGRRSLQSKGEEYNSEGRAVQSEACCESANKISRRRRWSTSFLPRQHLKPYVSNVNHLKILGISDTDEFLETTQREQTNKYNTAQLNRQFPKIGGGALKPKPRQCWNLSDKIESLNGVKIIERDEIRPFCGQIEDEEALRQITSDSDIWSEPDRNVSVQRIGLENQSLLVSPSTKRRSKDRTTKETTSSSNTKSHHEIRPKRRRSGSQNGQVEKRLSALERQQVTLNNLQDLLESLTSQLSQITETSHLDKTGSAQLSSEITSMKEILKKVTTELQSLKGSQDHISGELNNGFLAMQNHQVLLNSLQSSLDEVESRLSDINQAALANKNGSIDLSSEIETVNKALNKIISDMQHLKGTVENMAVKQDAGVIQELKESIDKVLKYVQSDDDEGKVSPHQMKRIAEEALAELDNYKKQLLSVTSSLFSKESAEYAALDKCDGTLITNLQLSINNEKAQNAKLLNDLNKLFNDNEALQKQLKEVEQKLAMEQKKCWALLLDEREINKDPNGQKVKELLKELSKNSSQKDDKIKSVETLCKELTTSLKETENKLKGLESRCQQYENELKMRCCEKEIVDGKLKGLRMQCQQYESDIVSANMKKEAAERKVQTQEEHLQRYKEILAKQQTSYINLSKAASEKQKLVEQLNAKCIEFEKEISTLKEKICSHAEQDEFLNEQIKFQTNKVAEMTTKRIGYENEKESLQNSIDHLHEQTVSLNEEVSENIIEHSKSVQDDLSEKSYNAKQQELHLEIEHLKAEIFKRDTLIHRQNEENNNLRKNIQVLNDQIYIMENTNQSLMEENNDIATQMVNSIKECFSKGSPKSPKIDEEGRTPTETIKFLKAQLKDKESVIQKLKSVIKDLQDSLNIVQNFHDQSGISNSSYDSGELQNISHKKKERMSTHVKKLEKQDEFKIQLAKLHEELEKKNTAIEEQNALLEARTLEKESLSKKCEKLSTDIVELDSSNKKLQEEIKIYKENLFTADQMMISARDSMQNMQSEISELNKTILCLKKEIKDKEIKDVIQKQKNAVTNLQRGVNDVSGTTKLVKMDKDNLSSQMNIMATEIANLKNETRDKDFVIQNQASEITKLASEIEELRENVQSKNFKTHEPEIAIAHAEKECKDANDNFDEMQTTKYEIQNAKHKIYTQVQAIIANLKTQVEKLQKDLNDKDLTIKEQLAINDELRKKCMSSNLTTEPKVTRSQIANLQNPLHELKTENACLQEELKSKANKIQEHEDTILKLRSHQIILDNLNEELQDSYKIIQNQIKEIPQLRGNIVGHAFKNINELLETASSKFETFTKKEYEDAKDKIRLSSIEISNLENENNSLKNQLEFLQKELQNKEFMLQEQDMSMMSLLREKRNSEDNFTKEKSLLLSHIKNMEDSNKDLQYQLINLRQENSNKDVKLQEQTNKILELYQSAKVKEKLSEEWQETFAVIQKEIQEMAQLKDTMLDHDSIQVLNELLNKISNIGKSFSCEQFGLKISDLNTQIKKQEKEINNKNRKLQNEEKLNLRLKGEIQNAQEELIKEKNSSFTKIANLKTHVSDLENQLETLQKGNKNKEREIQELNNDIIELQKSHKVKDELNKSLQQKYAIIQQQVKEVILSERSVLNNEVFNRLNELLGNVTDAAHSFTDESFKDETLGQNNQIRKLKNAITDKDDKIKELKISIDYLNKENENMLNNLTSEKLLISVQITDFKNLIEDLKNQMEILQNENNHKNLEIEECRRNIIDFEESERTKSDISKELQEEYRIIRKQIEEMSQLRKIDTECDAFKQLCEMLERIDNSIQSLSYENVRNETKKLYREIKKLNDKLSSKSDIVKKQEQFIAKLKRDNDQIKNKTIESRHLADKKITTLENVTSNLKSKLENLEKELNEKNHDIEEYKNKMTNFKNSNRDLIDEFKRKLYEQYAMIQKQVGEIVQLKGNISECDAFKSLCNLLEDVSETVKSFSYDSLRNDIEDLNLQIRKLKKEINNKDDIIQKQESLIDHLIKENQEAAHDRMKDRESLALRTSNLENLIFDLQEQIKNLKSDCENKNNMIQDHMNTIRDLNGEIDRLHKKVVFRKDDEEKSEKEWKRRKFEWLKRIEDSTPILKTELFTSEKTSSIISTVNDEYLKKQIENLNNELKTKEVKIKEYMGTIVTLQNDLESKNTLIKELTEEKELTSQDRTDLITNLNEQICNMRKKSVSVPCLPSDLQKNELDIAIEQLRKELSAKDAIIYEYENIIKEFKNNAVPMEVHEALLKRIESLEHYVEKSDQDETVDNLKIENKVLMEREDDLHLKEKKEINELKEENQLLQKKIKALQNNIDHQTKKSAVEKKRYDDLLKHRSSSTEQSLQKFEMSFKHLEKSFSSPTKVSAYEQITHLQEKIKKLENELSNALMKQQRQEESMNNLNDEIIAKSKEILNQQQQLSEQQDLIQLLRCKCDEKEKECIENKKNLIEQRNSAVSTMKNDLEHITNALASEKQRNDDLQKELFNMCQKFDEGCQKFRKLEKEKNALDEEKVALKSAFEDLQEKINAKHNECSKLKSEIIELKTFVTSATHSIPVDDCEEAGEDSVPPLNSDFEKLQKDLNRQQNKKLGHERNQTIHLHEELDQFAKEIGVLREELADKIKLLNSKEIEIIDLQNGLSEKDQEIQNLRKEISARKLSFIEKLYRDSGQEIQNLKRTSDENRPELCDLTQYVEEKLETFGEIIKNLHEDLVNKTELLDLEKGKNGHLCDEIRNLKKEITDKEVNLYEFSEKVRNLNKKCRGKNKIPTELKMDVELLAKQLDSEKLKNIQSLNELKVDKELLKVNKELNDIRSSVVDSHNSVIIMDKKCETLRNSIIELQAKLDQKIVLLAFEKEKNSKLLEELHLKDKVIQKVNEENAALKMSAIQSDATLNSADKMNMFETVKKKLEMDIRAQSILLDSEKDKNAKLQDDLGKADEEILKLSKDILDARLNAVKSYISMAKFNLSQNLSTILKLEHRLNASQDRNTMLSESQAELKQIRKENEHLETSFTHLEKTVKTDMERLNEENVKLQNNIKTLAEQRRKLEIMIADKKANLEAQKITSSPKSQSISKLNSEIQKKDEKILKLESRISMLQEKLSQLVQQLDIPLKKPSSDTTEEQGNKISTSRLPPLKDSGITSFPSKVVKSQRYKQLITELSTTLNTTPEVLLEYISQYPENYASQRKITTKSAPEKQMELYYQDIVDKLKSENTALTSELNRSKQKATKQNKKLSTVTKQLTPNFDELKKLMGTKWALQRRILKFQKELCKVNSTSIKKQSAFIDRIRNMYSITQSSTILSQSETTDVSISTTQLVEEFCSNLKLDIECLYDTKTLFKHFIIPLISNPDHEMLEIMDTLAENACKKFNLENFGSIEYFGSVCHSEEDVSVSNSYMYMRSSSERLKSEISSLRNENESLRDELMKLRSLVPKQLLGSGAEECSTSSSTKSQPEQAVNKEHVSSESGASAPQETERSVKYRLELDTDVTQRPDYSSPDQGVYSDANQEPRKFDYEGLERSLYETEWHLNTPYAILPLEDFELLKKEVEGCGVEVKLIISRTQMGLTILNKQGPLAKSFERSILRAIWDCCTHADVCLSRSQQILNKSSLSSNLSFHQDLLHRDHVQLEMAFRQLRAEKEEQAAKFASAMERLKQFQHQKNHSDRIFLRQLVKTKKVLREVKSNLTGQPQNPHEEND